MAPPGATVPSQQLGTAAPAAARATGASLSTASGARATASEGAKAQPGTAGGTAPATQVPHQNQTSPARPSLVRSPVLVASVGTYSGPVGSAARPMLDGAQVWVNYINRKGGLNGHPVNLVVYDDGGDTARSSAAVQDAVERRKVIAFFQQSQVITGGCCVDYITQKRIPVVGTDSGHSRVYGSPMYFPQTASGELIIAAAAYSAAQEAIPAGKKKLSLIMCVEVPACSDVADRVWSNAAPKAGFEIVHKARSSLAQPDFTAQCLAARNAGAEVMLVTLDANSIGRLAASCARQGYRPLFGSPSVALTDEMKADPNLDGLVGSDTVFPWFQTGTPATDEYTQAMAALGSKIPRAVQPPVGWVSGKLLEKAARNMPEPPTSGALLQGLWSIRGDDLGGLTNPLTYVENKPPTPVLCYWTVKLSHGSWVSPDGFKRSCQSL